MEGPLQGLVVQAQDLVSVHAPLLHVRLEVGEEDNVWLGEGACVGLVLGAEDALVLELLGELIEVVALLRLAARKVKDDHARDWVAVKKCACHVPDCPAVEEGAGGGAEDVVGERGLAAVAPLIVHPKDVTVCRLAVQLADNHLLPCIQWPADPHVRHSPADPGQCLHAPVELHKFHRMLLRDALQAVGL